MPVFILTHTHVDDTIWGSLVGGAVYLAASLMCLRAALIGPIRLVRSMGFLTIICLGQAALFTAALFFMTGPVSFFLADALRILMWITALAIVYVAHEAHRLGRNVERFDRHISEVERLEDEIGT